MLGDGGDVRSPGSGDVRPHQTITYKHPATVRENQFVLDCVPGMDMDEAGAILSLWTTGKVFMRIVQSHSDVGCVEQS